MERQRAEARQRNRVWHLKCRRLRICRLFDCSCREHAFFFGFLLANYFMNNEKLGVQDVRIIYTKSYKVMDNKIVFFEEHVFPIVKKNN